MKLSDSLLSKLVVIITYLYILLFVYASISKLLDLENFQIQLAQSPLLSAYAGAVSVSVIGVELLLVIFLCFKSLRLIGLYGSFAIMISFSVYIYLILNYSDFVPCSCGGVLEKLGWTEHLVFNLVFVLLALLATLILEKKKHTSILKLITVYTVILIVSSALVLILFFTSEYVIKKENNFIRRFIPHAVNMDNVSDLKVNSNYFAGYSNNQIYLGNYTAPLQLTILDASLQQSKIETIKLDNSNFTFRNVMVTIKDSDFYLYDGSVPIIYRGNVGDLSGKTISYSDCYFDQLRVIDSVNFAFRSLTLKQQNVLGKLNLQSTQKVSLNENLIRTQKDGIFDTDGNLIYDEASEDVIYTYNYRNAILVMNKDLSLLRKLKTIDTISKATVNVKTLSDGKRKMSAPPLLVNKKSFVHRGLLFNISNLKGKFESNEIWDQATIIDLYSTKEQVYRGSFFIQHRGKEKLSQFIVTDEHLYALIGNEIIRYRFAQAVMNHFEKGQAENL